jgi:chorismate mutase
LAAQRTKAAKRARSIAIDFSSKARSDAGLSRFMRRRAPLDTHLSAVLRRSSAMHSTSAAPDPRTTNTEQHRAVDRVSVLRESIDRIDEQLVALIGERQRLARAVGVAKHRAALPPVDATRESTVLSKIAAHASDHGVAENEMRLLAEQLIRMARTTQGLPTVVRREAA